MRSAAVPIRVSLIGVGMVGEWLLRAIGRHRDRLRDRYGVDLKLVALASRRGGFVYSEEGIEIEGMLASGDPLTSVVDLVRGDRWPTALAGLESTETDILVEASQSPSSDGEPGLAHLRHALRRGVSVATSNKWPVALAGVELTTLAERHGTGFRAESTVMSGTPVLAALTTGLGGAEPVRLRGIVNATVNLICSRMAAGGSYADGLAEAQEAGLAELEPRAGRSAVEARPTSAEDPFFAVDGTTNAIRLDVDPLGEIAISGPGAGRALAGQGVFSDLIALARERARRYG